RTLSLPTRRSSDLGGAAAMACTRADPVAGLATTMPRVPAMPARSLPAAPLPAASAATPPAVTEARSQPAVSRTRQAMTGRMLRMAVLTVGLRALYVAVPVQGVRFVERQARGADAGAHGAAGASDGFVLHHPAAAAVERAFEPRAEQHAVRFAQRAGGRLVERPGLRARVDQPRRVARSQQRRRLCGVAQHQVLQRELEVHQAAFALLEVEAGGVAAV